MILSDKITNDSIELLCHISGIDELLIVSENFLGTKYAICVNETGNNRQVVFYFKPRTFSNPACYVRNVGGN